MSARFNIQGYTLIELMVALAAGAFLLAGVSMSYSAIKSTTLVSKELENAQEVIRYTSSVFTRSLKQTPELPTLSEDKLSITIKQPAGVVNCIGEVTSSAVNERYYLDTNNLMCALGDKPAQRLLTGIEGLNFSINNYLVSIEVKPQHLPEQFAAGLVIDVAVSNVILSNAFGEV